MPWVELCPADAVPPAGIRGVDLGDRELVVWRTAGGEPVVCDARCPHQWSHLEADGVVDGDELVCTAHFWRFDTGGRGTKLNVKGRRDPKADVAVLAVREVEGRLEALLPATDSDHDSHPGGAAGDTRQTGQPPETGT